jgi:hypothetical protein
VKKESVNPMHRANAAPRCSARSKRSGKPCKSPSVTGKHVCRMHGAGGGAPRGRAHGRYRHGQFTCEAIEHRRAIASLLRFAQITATKL